MKRFHVRHRVENLEQSIRFYTGLFGVAPTPAGRARVTCCS